MTAQQITRRSFLKVAGLTVAAATVACSGAGYAVMRSPAAITPELTFGKENTMNSHLLVAYATRAGSTAEIAAAIGESLRQRSFAVDVKPIKDKPSLTDYQTIILGSAIRMGKWLPEATKFIEANQATLSQLPVALFTVHMLNVGEDETSRAARLAYLTSIRPLLNGAEEVYFEGKMDLTRLSAFDRFIAKMVKAVDADRRDWGKIRAWVPATLA